MRRSKWLLLVLLLSLATGTAFAGCGSTGAPDAEQTHSTESSSTGGTTNKHRRARCPGGLHDLRPARIVRDARAAIDAEDISRVVNGWTFTTPCETRTVQAGAADAAETTGALVISCLCLRGPDLYDDELLEVAGTGALRIVRAPEGERTQARLDRATLEFAGPQGARGTLDLRTGRVTCSSSSASCQPIPVHECEPLERVEAASSAGGIRAWGLDCAAADEFVKHAPGACAHSLPCEADGFVCKENYRPAVGNVPVWCQRGSQRIDINWIVA